MYNTTYNHYNYINLKPRFQNICAKNIGAHNMHKQILKYTQLLAVKNQAKLIAKLELAELTAKS